MLPPLKFSIVTPSFNHAAYLEQAMRSVLEQESVQVEYFVHDGGSTDGSAGIIRRYADRLAGWRSAPDRGQTDAIVQGWQKATGDVVAWLNSDDYYLPGTLARVAEEFQRDARALVVIGTCRLINESGQLVGEKYARGFNLSILLATSGGVPGQPAVFIRREVLDKVGLPDPGLQYVMDWEYWIRLGLHLEPEQVRVLYQPLSVSRTWPGTKTMTGVKAICQEHRQVLERLFASGALPPELQKMEKQALAGTYFKQAFLEWKAGRPAAARHSLAKARALSLAGITPWHAILWQARTWIPYGIYARLQTIWRRLRTIFTN